MTLADHLVSSQDVDAPGVHRGGWGLGWAVQRRGDDPLPRGAGQRGRHVRLSQRNRHRAAGRRLPRLRQVMHTHNDTDTHIPIHTHDYIHTYQSIITKCGTVTASVIYIYICDKYIIYKNSRTQIYSKVSKDIYIYICDKYIIYKNSRTQIYSKVSKDIYNIMGIFISIFPNRIKTPQGKKRWSLLPIVATYDLQITTLATV